MLDGGIMNATDLQERLRGRAYTPGDDGYDDARQPWNLAVEQRPGVVVMAESTADVTAAVTYARDQGLPLGVQSTGHGAVHDYTNGVLLNLARLSAVSVDRTRQRAEVAAGTRWREVLQELDTSGLAALSGTALSTGVVGYTLGGGLGLMMRQFGFAADSVVSATVVTADGSSVQASENENADLFWGLKGGSGNFGVLTSLEFQLYPIREVYNGVLTYPAEHAVEVLTAWSRWAEEVGDEVTSAAMLAQVPPLPTVPEPLRGRRIVAIRAMTANGDTGPVQALRAELGAPVMDTFTASSYLRAALSGMEPEEPTRSAGRTALFSELSSTTIERMVTLAGVDAPATMIEVRHLGGASGRAPRLPSAVCHRDARYVLAAHSIVGTPEMAAPAEEYLLEAFEAMRPEAYPGVFINFLPPGSSADEVRAAYDEETYHRLQDLKRVYDPGNLFRFNHNIPPA